MNTRRLERQAEHRPERQRHVLVVTTDDVWGETLERLLRPQGYTVVRVSSGAAALEHGARLRPDAVLTERELPDLGGIELCRIMRDAAWSDPTTPVVVRSGSQLDAAQRLELLRAGAWDVLPSPADPDEVVVRIHNYLAAREAADTARVGGLIDRETGLYNDEGLLRRGEELLADAFRRHAALACLALTPDEGPDASYRRTDPTTVARQVADLLHAVRKSDVAGRHGPAEFIILAPRTDPAGAVGLARRLSHTPLGPRLRVGYDAVPNVRETPTPAPLLIRWAVEALHRTSTRTSAAAIQPYRPFEHRQPEGSLAWQPK